VPGAEIDDPKRKNSWSLRLLPGSSNVDLNTGMRGIVDTGSGGAIRTFDPSGFRFKGGSKDELGRHRGGWDGGSEDGIVPTFDVKAWRGAGIIFVQ